MDKPPFKEQIEGLMIACLLFYPELLKVLHIKQEYFYSKKFNTAYLVLDQMNFQDEEINAATFQARVSNEGMKYSDLIRDWIYTGEITPLSAQTHLKILAEEYAKRVIWESYNDLALAPQEFIEKVKAIEVEFIQQKVPSLEESIDEYLERWKEKVERRERDGATGIITGFDFVDKHVGIERGHFVVLAALTSVGKSALSLNMAVNCAQYGFNVLFFSVEMTTEGLLDRIFARLTKTNSAKFKYANAEDELVEVKREIGALKENLKIINLSGGTSDDICRITTRENSKKPVDFIVVDYLQILDDELQRGQTLANKVGGIARKLKKLAGDCDLACMALSQFNREASKMKEMPKIHQLRESGEIENHSDVILILHRDSRTAKIAKLKAAKVRNGISGQETTLGYTPETTTFTDGKKQMAFESQDFWYK